MGFDLAILDAIKTLYEIIKKVMSFYKKTAEANKKNNEKIKTQSEKILKGVSALIDGFTETCDLIVHTLAQVYDKRMFTAGTVIKISQANRRLFELSSDMRILTNSLSNRLPEVDITKLKMAVDACAQIIIVENYIGIELLNYEHFSDLLPIDVSSDRDVAKVAHKLYTQGQVPSISKLHLNTLNKALLDLRSYKENLAYALDEIE